MIELLTNLKKIYEWDIFQLISIIRHYKSQKRGLREWCKRCIFYNTVSCGLIVNFPKSTVINFIGWPQKSKVLRRHYLPYRKTTSSEFFWSYMTKAFLKALRDSNNQKNV